MKFICFCEEPNVLSHAHFLLTSPNWSQKVYHSSTPSPLPTLAGAQIHRKSVNFGITVVEVHETEHSDLSPPLK
jgi:hypothetical protein